MNITKGEIRAKFCINIMNDTELEIHENFTLVINATELHPNIVLVFPQTAVVTILDDECKHQ